MNDNDSRRAILTKFNFMFQYHKQMDMDREFNIYDSAYQGEWRKTGYDRAYPVSKLKAIDYADKKVRICAAKRMVDDGLPIETVALHTKLPMEIVKKVSVCKLIDEIEIKCLVSEAQSLC